MASVTKLLVLQKYLFSSSALMGSGSALPAAFYKPGDGFPDPKHVRLTVRQARNNTSDNGILGPQDGHRHAGVPVPQSNSHRSTPCQRVCKSLPARWLLIP